MAENRIEDSTIKKNVVMESDVKNTSNVFKGSSAESIKQKIDNQEQNLSLLGFGRARGRYAVVALAVVVICYLLYHFLVRGHQ